MPTSFLSADAGFPRLTADVPAEERLNRVQSYLYLLLEQLRYILSNLGEDNFNQESLKEIERDISEPIMQTVTDMSGDVSTLEQTAAALTTRLDNFNGSSSTIEQTATSLTTRVTDAEGDISTVSQTANRINWVVASGTSASDMTLTPETISLVAAGINISGYVTFTALENDAATAFINGNNIELRSDEYGDSVSSLKYLDADGALFAKIFTRENPSGSTVDQAKYAFAITTSREIDNEPTALKLVAGYAMSLEADNVIFVKAERQTILNSGTLPTRIQGSLPYDSTWPAADVPADCYVFCSDGIYYNGVRIVAT